VALPDDKVRDLMNSEIVHTTAAAPVTYSLRSDDLDFLVFCFAKPEDAEAFAERFGGRRSPMTKR